MAVGPVPVAHPVPNIATHVVQAVTIGGKTHHRRGSHKSIFLGVFVGKISGPCIGHELAIALEFITPRIALAFKPTARGEFPLGFGGQTLAGPFRISIRIVPRHLHHRVLLASIKIALRALGMLPVGTRSPAPPHAHFTQVDRPIGRGENQRTGLQHFIGRLRRAGRDLFFQLLPVDRPLSSGLVTSSLNKLAKLRIGHGMLIDPEPIDPHLHNRPFVHAAARQLTAHQKLAAFDHDHACRRCLGAVLGANHAMQAKHQNDSGCKSKYFHGTRKLWQENLKVNSMILV